MPHLTGHGFAEPESLCHESGRIFRQNDRKPLPQPYDTLEIVDDRPSKRGECINMNEPLIAYSNRFYGRKNGLSMTRDAPDPSVPMTQLKDSFGLEISFQRTLRMPDDNRLHQLPVSMGMFPLYNVEAYAERLPEQMVRDGGIFLPMWQREALWINFTPAAPPDEEEAEVAVYGQRYALRIFVGGINAISGRHIDEEPSLDSSGNRHQEYIVVPGQVWLDGICVAPGVIRQFVAMPRTPTHIPRSFE
jgi:hypothetical protein